MNIYEYDPENGNFNNTIIWGRGIFGVMIAFALNLFCARFVYCDADCGGQKNKSQWSYMLKERLSHIRVVNFEELCEEYDNNSDIILMASPIESQKCDMDFIGQKGIDIVYSPWAMLDKSVVRDYFLSNELFKDRNNYYVEQKNKGNLTTRDEYAKIKVAYIERKAEQVFQEQRMKPEGLYLISVDAIVSEKCSMKCKNCSNLMQYYKKAGNINVEDLKQAIDTLLLKVDRIQELRIIGGEPFLNKDFVDLVNAYNDEDKIMRIGVWSNATIFPNNEILSHLTKDKIIMRFSDYGEKSRKLNKWISWCEDNSVAYTIFKMNTWHDCGKLERHSYSEYDLKRIYSTCECRNIPTILKGRLYGCAYSANAANLGAMYNEEKEKDGLLLTENTTKDDIDSFLFERPFLEACRYCKGRNRSRAFVINPAEQCTSPLPYVRLSERNKKETEELKLCPGQSGELLSIIIPAFNAEQSIERCINSISAQLYDNLEIILIDDGSKDNTGNICKKLSERDNRIRYFYQKHMGVSYTRKRGIDLAKGKYIGFVDSDDWIDEGYFEELMSEIKDCDLIMSGFIVENAVSPDRISPWIMDRGQSESQYVNIPLRNGVYAGEEMKLIWKYMFWNNAEMIDIPVYLWNKLFKAELLKHISASLDNRIWIAEDSLLTHIYFSKCRSVYITGLKGYHYDKKNKGITSCQDYEQIIVCFERYYNCLRKAFEGHECEEMLQSRLLEEFYFYISGYLKRIVNKQTREVKFPWGYYPYYGRLEGEKIILYGAGNVGKMLRHYILEERKCDLVLWVDKDACSYEKEQLPVYSVERIKMVDDYDHIIIAVGEEAVAKEIREELLKMEVTEEKIMWCKVY